jgi:hypothetical protein
MKREKAFSGSLGSGLPFDDFEAGFEKIEVVQSNLDHLRPMIKSVREMTEMPGWTDYIQPFLIKQADARRLVLLIKEKSPSVEQEAAKIEAFGSLLNYINTLAKTADSMARIDAKVAEIEDDGDEDTTA